MAYQILTGDNRISLKQFPDNHFDSIVTDPPYGIDFLGKSWDATTGALETYQECLRVLKPGGHILAFSAARTYHHLAITLEQAGFEIRDQIMWIYSSGFPKSQDIGRQIQKSIYGKPDKQRFDPAIMIKIDGDKYKHPDSDKVYRKLPDINGDRLKKSHEGQGYGCVFEEVLDIKKVPHKNNVPRNGGAGETKHYESDGQVVVTDPEAQQWAGWGTALKPAHEPIVMARKPLKTSIRENCQTWGVGALNIDATRVPYVNEKDIKSAQFGRPSTGNHSYINTEAQAIRDNLDVVQANEAGRFPSNVIGEIPDYQKYFYCPKVSRKERHMGFSDLPKRLCGPGGKEFVQAQDHQRSNTDALIDRKYMVEVMGGKWVNDAGEHLESWIPDANSKSVWLPHKGVIYAHELTHEYSEWCKNNNVNPGNVGNNHPTVKPVALMEYLIRLVTPPGGHVLDPFNGSGSTGMAAVGLGYDYTGLELDPHYVAIAERRIAAWYQATHPLEATGLFE